MINTLSGKDVVSLGLGGSGSAEAMVAYPKQAYYYSERAWFLRLPTPELAVVYFYEGNDLLNNVRFLKRRFAENGLEGLDRANAVERLDRAIAAYPSRFLPAHEPDWRRHFPFYFFMKKLALMTLDLDTKHLKHTKHLKLKTKHQKGTKQQKRLKQQKPEQHGSRPSGLPQRSSISMAGRRNCVADCSLPEWTSILRTGVLPRLSSSGLLPISVLSCPKRPCLWCTSLRRLLPIA